MNEIQEITYCEDSCRLIITDKNGNKEHYSDITVKKFSRFINLKTREEKEQFINELKQSAQ